MIEYFFRTAKAKAFIFLSHLPKEALAADLDQIGQLIELECTDLQDSIDRYEIPRIDYIKNNVLIFSRYPLELDNVVVYIQKP